MCVLEVAIGSVFSNSAFRLALVGAWVGLCTASWGQGGERKFSAVLPYGGAYPPELWLPVKMEFVNGTEQAIDGEGVIPVADDRGGVEIRRRVLVPPRCRLTAISYAYFPAKPKAIEQRVKGGFPLLSYVEWQAATADRLRSDIYGVPMEESMQDAGEAITSGFPGTTLLAVGGSQITAAYETTSFTQFIRGLAGYPLAPRSLEARDLPRDLIGYDGARIVVLDAIDPDVLDYAQRQTLLDLMRHRGGTVILPCPVGEGDPSRSWLAPYLPVQIIGGREVSELRFTDSRKDAGALKLSEQAVALCEAVETAQSHVVFRDEQYVHAAYKQVGLGRLVFTSFPINALDSKDARTRAIWQRLLEPAAVLREGRGSEYYTGREALLQSRMGKSTIRWGVAAGITGGFVVLVVAVHVLLRGARRPMAFALGIAASLLLSILLVGASLVRVGQQQLEGWRLATLDISPEGGGMQQEVIAYLGKDDRSFALKASEQAQNVWVRPLLAGPERPTVQFHPLLVRGAGVHALKIQRIWEADGPLPEQYKATASGVFGPEGLTLSIDNGLEQELQGPMFLWQRRVFPLQEIAGKSRCQRVVQQANAPGDFTNSTGIISEKARFQGEWLRGLSTPSVPSVYAAPPMPPPQLVAFLQRDVPRIIEASQEIQVPLPTWAMVRLPVRIGPSPIGSVVKIPAGLNRIVPHLTAAVMYNHITEQWQARTQDAAFLIGFEAPWEIGKLKITQATIQAEMDAPQQHVVIRRGQSSSGKVLENPNPAGPMVADWSGLATTGTQSTTFSCSAGDADRLGRLWLYVEVTGPPLDPTKTKTPALWQFKSLQVTLTGQVVPDLAGDAQPPKREP